MLSKYGILYNKYLEEYKPITYQELIMNGTINHFLELKNKEYNDLRNSIIMELKNKYKKPNTYSFIELANYNNFIYNKADELVIWTICPKIIKTYRE